MKKQVFIIPFIACMLAMFNVKAQNTPIDDFLKKYPSKEGVTTVTMSQQMLQSIFAPPQKVGTTQSRENFFFIELNQNVPEAYSSVTISKEDIPENLFSDFKKILLSSKYEQYMEMAKESYSNLGYYLKKVNDQTNEIVVLRHQKNQFSAIYIKGDINFDNLDRYLITIRTKLNVLGATNQNDMFPYDHQFAFSLPSFDNLNFPSFKEFHFKSDSTFNFKWNEDLKLRMEEYMEDKIKQAEEE